MAIISKKQQFFLCCLPSLFFTWKMALRTTKLTPQQKQNFKLAIKPSNKWKRDLLMALDKRNGGGGGGGHNSSTFWLGHSFNDFLRIFILDHFNRILFASDLGENTNIFNLS